MTNYIDLMQVKNKKSEITESNEYNCNKLVKDELKHH